MLDSGCEYTAVRIGSPLPSAGGVGARGEGCTSPLINSRNAGRGRDNAFAPLCYFQESSVCRPGRSGVRTRSGNVALERTITVQATGEDL